MPTVTRRPVSPHCRRAQMATARAMVRAASPAADLDLAAGSATADLAITAATTRRRSQTTARTGTGDACGAARPLEPSAPSLARGGGGEGPGPFSLLAFRPAP